MPKEPPWFTALRKHLKENNVGLCKQGLDSCPCWYEVEDELLRKYRFCNFANMDGEFFWGAEKGNMEKRKTFLNRVCEEVRTHVITENRITELVQKDARKFLREVNIGDVVYDTRHSDEVTLLKKPSKDEFDCKCLTQDGRERFCRPFHLKIIQQGNFSAERAYKTELEAIWAKLDARRFGFRAEVVKNDNKYVLRIFGDSQEEVDDFITLYIEKDFVVF